MPVIPSLPNNKQPRNKPGFWHQNRRLRSIFLEPPPPPPNTREISVSAEIYISPLGEHVLHAAHVVGHLVVGAAAERGDGQAAGARPTHLVRTRQTLESHALEADGRVWGGFIDARCRARSGRRASKSPLAFM